MKNGENLQFIRGKWYITIDMNSVETMNVKEDWLEIKKEGKTPRCCDLYACDHSNNSKLVGTIYQSVSYTHLDVYKRQT